MGGLYKGKQPLNPDNKNDGNGLKDRELICYHWQGGQERLQYVHQLEMKVGEETFYVEPYGDNMLRVICNKKIKLEQSINGVTVIIDEQ